MLIVALLGTTVALGALILLVARLATIALPLFVGITIGIALLRQGYEGETALVIAFVTVVATLIGGQIAFATTRSKLLRTALALLFVVPAGMAGYSVAYGVMGIGSTSEGLRVVVGSMGAIGTSWTAFVRLLAGFPTKPAIGQPAVYRD